MTRKRVLLSYHPVKHPHIEEFFNSIEEGLRSHYVREAIEFYMKYKGKEEKLSPEALEMPSEDSLTEFNTQSSENAKSDNSTVSDDFSDTDLSGL